MAKVISEQKLRLPDSDKEVTVRVMARESYQPNLSNTNKGTDRGNNALRTSMGQVGFARGILTAADRGTVAGNHSMQAAEEDGIIDYWIEVDSDGTYGIVTRRIDWDSVNDPAAVAAAIQDNRVQELNYMADAVALEEAIATLDDTEFEIDALLFTEGELGFIFSDESDSAEDKPIFDGDDPEELDHQAGESMGDRHIVNAILSWAEMQEWKAWKESMGYPKDKDAIIALMRS